MQTFVRVFASLWLTIPILLAIAVILILGTVGFGGIGLDASIGAIRKDWYRAWWFQGLLALLAVNLITCTIKRKPWQIWQWGFITTHWGILMIILGSSVSGLTKVYGSMPIHKGESLDYVQLEDERELRLEWEDGHRDVIPIEYNWYEESNPGDVFPVRNGSLRVLKYLPNVHRQARDPRPHIDVIVDFAGEKMRLSIPQGEMNQDTGRLAVGFMEMSDEHYRDLVAHSREKAPPAQSHFTIIRTGAAWHYLMGSSKGQFEFGDLEVGGRVRYPWMPIPLHLELTAFRESGEIAVRTAKPEQNVPLFPAMELQLKSGGAVALGWILFTEDPEQDNARQFAIGGRKVNITFGPKRYHDLKMVVHLKDARRENHPGGTAAAKFESDIVIHDLVTGKKHEARIRVNEPVTIRGYSFYMSSFNPPKTTFQVLYDPGTRIIYLGALIAVSGTLFMFYLKPVILKARGDLQKLGTALHGPGLGHYLLALPVPIAAIAVAAVRSGSPAFAYRYGRAIAVTWILATAVLACYLGVWVI